jgi:hypothetical protein
MCELVDAYYLLLFNLKLSPEVCQWKYRFINGDFSVFHYRKFDRWHLRKKAAADMDTLYCLVMQQQLVYLITIKFIKNYFE